MATEPRHSSWTDVPVSGTASRFFLLLGTVVGVVETLAFRLVGQYVVDPAAPLVLFGVYATTIPAMLLLTYPVYAWRGVTGPERQAASVLYVLPLLFFDVAALAAFPTVFPNMGPGTARYFGSVVLFGFGIVLVTGFVPRR